MSWVALSSIIDQYYLSSPLTYQRGGTGLNSSGASGNYLVSTGSGWQSKAPITSLSDDTVNDVTIPTTKAVWDIASPELLWTNDNPDSSFTAQTLTINWTAHRFLLIEYSSYRPSSYDKDLSSMSLLFQAEENKACKLFSADDVNRYRIVTLINQDDTAKIQFSEGTYYETYNSPTTNINNNHIIPLKIYGLF